MRRRARPVPVEGARTLDAAPDEEALPLEAPQGVVDLIPGEGGHPLGGSPRRSSTCAKAGNSSDQRRTGSSSSSKVRGELMI